MEDSNYLKMVRFIKSIILSNSDIDKKVREEALELYFIVQSGIEEVIIDGRKHNLTSVEYAEIETELNEYDRKIQAIKILRARTGVGLKAAKDAIEDPRNFEQKITS